MENDDDRLRQLKEWWRRHFLEGMKGGEFLDQHELSLFEWYVHENSKIIDQMLSEERAFAQQQGFDLADSDGMVAVEYHIKRALYADVIYMASLLETYLARACERLIVVLGDHSVGFRPEELAGDKWTKRQKFLERYAHFAFPEDAWSDLQILIRVRNILVHENGSSFDLSKESRNEIKKRPGISIIQHKFVRKVEYELVIDKEFVDHCLSAFKSVIEFVDKQIDTAIDRSLRPQVATPA